MIALNWPFANETVTPSSARTIASPRPYTFTASVARAATGRACDTAAGTAVVFTAIGFQGSRSACARRSKPGPSRVAC